MNRHSPSDQPLVRDQPTFALQKDKPRDQATFALQKDKPRDQATFALQKDKPKQQDKPTFAPEKQDQSTFVPQHPWKLSQHSSSSSDDLDDLNMEGEDLTLQHVPIEDWGISLTDEHNVGT